MFLRPFVAALATALFTAATAAGTVTVKFDNPIFGLLPSGPKSDQVKLWYPKTGGGSKELTTNAGRFTGVATGSVDFDLGTLVDLDAGSPVHFAMYCYDLDESIASGNQVVYTVDVDGESQRSRDFLGAVNAELNKNKAQADPYAWLRPGNALIGAAIQIGLWESLYDASSTWSVASNNASHRGSFYAQNLENDTAQWLQRFFVRLNSTGDYTPLAPGAVIVLRATGRQDMITGDPPTAQVPVSGTLSLVALGAAAAMLRRRRG